MTRELGESSARARRWVRSTGFRLADEPEHAIPILPADITNIGESELMGLFGAVNSWLDYVEVQFVSAQIDEKQAEQDLEKIQALEQIKYKGEKSVTTAKAYVFQNSDYLDQRDRTATSYARRKMLETVYNSLERKRFIVSRELTRRSYGSD